MTADRRKLELKDADWTACEDAARWAAIVGGISAMGQFQGALGRDEKLNTFLNAATTTDVQATSAILNSLLETVPLIAGRLDLGYSFFAEELERSDGKEGDAKDNLMSRIVDRLGSNSLHVKRTTAEFAHTFPNCICALFDALDGTTNFSAGIPLFCSAVSLFIEGEPRVGAIYDPSRNIAYCGSLRTNDNDGSPNIGNAWSWQVSSGHRKQLLEDSSEATQQRLIATHLTRSGKGYRSQMISKLDQLSDGANGVFMINSGQLSLALVASGQFSAYVNNYTNVWDIAAGAVLIQAVGGRVTDFSGRELTYGAGTKVQVVASKNCDLHNEILKIVNG